MEAFYRLNAIFFIFIFYRYEFFHERVQLEIDNGAGGLEVVLEQLLEGGIGISEDELRRIEI